MSKNDVLTAEEFEEYNRLREEFNSTRFKKLLNQTYEKKCVNCLSEIDIEFHHIVPLSEGGTNNLTNIVPLCLPCHHAYHDGRHRNRYVGRITGKTGRNTKTPYEKAAYYFASFLNGEIGASECMEKLGYKSGTHMADLSMFKKYLKEKKIEEFKNNIDMLMFRGKIKVGDKVGYIKYANGEIKNIYYKKINLRENKDNQLEFDFV